MAESRIERTYKSLRRSGMNEDRAKRQAFERFQSVKQRARDARKQRGYGHDDSDG